MSVYLVAGWRKELGRGKAKQSNSYQELWLRNFDGGMLRENAVIGT